MESTCLDLPPPYMVIVARFLLFTCGEAYRSRRAFDSVVRRTSSVRRHFIICGSG